MHCACNILAAVLALAPASQAMELPGVEGGRTQYLPLVIREATVQGIPPALADAVAMVETGYRPDAIGSSGEIGLMQIMPATARQLGFSGTAAELADPATNITLGVRYLARAWALGGGDICRSLMKYRAGLGEEAMTPLSVAYCTRAIAWLGSTGSRLAQGAVSPDSIPSPTPSADPYVIAVVPALAAQTRLFREQVTQRAPDLTNGLRRKLAEQGLGQTGPSPFYRQSVHQHRNSFSEQLVLHVQAAVEASLAQTGP